MQTNKTKFKQNPQVLLWFPERNLQGFLKGIPARHSCKGSSKGFLQRFRQKFQHQSQQGIFVFNCLPQREKKQKKTLRRCRSCLRIGSSKAAELFRQSSSQTSNITTRHIKQSKKTMSTHAVVHKKMFQPAVPQGSSKVSPCSCRAPAIPASFQRSFNNALPRFQQGSTEVRFQRVPARFQQQQGFRKVPARFHHVPAELQQFQQVSSEVLTMHYQGSSKVPPR